MRSLGNVVDNTLSSINTKDIASNACIMKGAIQGGIKSLWLSRAGLCLRFNVLCCSQYSRLDQILWDNDCGILSLGKGLSKCGLASKWATYNCHSDWKVQRWCCIWRWWLGSGSDVMDGSAKCQVECIKLGIILHEQILKD